MDAPVWRLARPGFGAVVLQLGSFGLSNISVFATHLVVTFIYSVSI